VSAIEIENAIRQLPRDEVTALLERVKDLSLAPATSRKELTDEVIAKWRGRLKLPFGIKTTDEYLRMVRGYDCD
jgi:hypothetical protein